MELIRPALREYRTWTTESRRWNHYRPRQGGIVIATYIPLYDEVRYIHVARDGRDAAMSQYNQWTGFSDRHRENFDRIGREHPTIGRPYPKVPTDI
jgi:hypothetical protein